MKRLFIVPVLSAVNYNVQLSLELRRDIDVEYTVFFNSCFAGFYGTLPAALLNWLT